MNTSHGSKPRTLAQRPPERSVIAFRGVMAVAYIVAGIVIAAKMFAFAPHAGMKIATGVVLGIAMVALGVHRLWLIRRAVALGAKGRPG